MFLKTVWAVVLLVFNATVCNALTIPPSESSLISTSAPLINTFSPRDTNLATSSNDILVECSESRYGSGLRYASCLDAFSTFHEGGTTNPVRVGRRGTGHDYAQSLPWRWVSGTITGFSLCYCTVAEESLFQAMVAVLSTLLKAGGLPLKPQQGNRLPVLHGSS